LCSDQLIAGSSTINTLSSVADSEYGLHHWKPISELQSWHTGREGSLEVMEGHIFPTALLWALKFNRAMCTSSCLINSQSCQTVTPCMTNGQRLRCLCYPFVMYKQIYFADRTETSSVHPPSSRSYFK